MTLFRQIAIIFSMFIVPIIGLLMYLNFHTANEFIQNQLYSTSQDTANSLALSLSMKSSKNDKDLSVLKTKINDIFDRGYYESIVLHDMDGNKLIENKNKLKIKGVPDWFVKNIHIVAPTAKSEVFSGSIPYRILSIKLYSGYAYLELWKTFINILNIFAILVIITLLFFYFLLRIVLKSLKQVEIQAIAITNNNFIIQEKLPFTNELKNLVIGMNEMVKKVKNIFEHEILVVKKYNDLLYNYQDTEIGNRKFFSLKFSSLLEQNNTKSSGTLILLNLNNFTDTKENIGYNKLNTYINKLVQLFYEISNDIEESAIARLKESEFVLILPATNDENAQKIINIFLKKSQNLKNDELKKIKEFYISAGVSYYNEKNTQKEILAQADFALSSAKMKSESNVYFLESECDEKITKIGKQELNQLISNALNQNGIKLSFQSVKNINGKIYHQKMYLRIIDKEGNSYPARVFMPILKSLNKTNDVDKRVIELAFSITEKDNSKAIAINITTTFIKKIQNLYWLESVLKKNSLHNISFEANNYEIINNFENFENFTKLIQKYQYNFGIDNFSISFNTLQYLQHLKPSYIKANK